MARGQGKPFPIEPACCIVPFSNLRSTFETVRASEHVCMKSEPRAQFQVFQFWSRRKVRPEKSRCRHVCSLEYCVRSSSLQGRVLACREEFLGSTLLMHAFACTKVYQQCFSKLNHSSFPMHSRAIPCFCICCFYDLGSVCRTMSVVRACEK